MEINRIHRFGSSSFACSDSTRIIDSDANTTRGGGTTL